MSAFEVIVGNVGRVYSGEDEEEARKVFDTYPNSGRSEGEPITLLRDGEPIAERQGLSRGVFS